MAESAAISTVEMASPTVTSRLRCTLTNSPGNEKIPSSRATGESISIPIWFRQEEGKKSSFALESPLLPTGSSASNSATAPSSKKPLHHGLEKPAHAIIDCCCSNDGKASVEMTFLFAGMEIISNSRNIETYSTDEEGNEKYLFTSRGMRVETDSENDENGAVADFGLPEGLGGEPPPKPEWYKCVMINPGGPETIRCLHLKLLSLRPARASRVNIRLLKLKGRIPSAEDLKTNPGLVNGKVKQPKEKNNGAPNPPQSSMVVEEMNMVRNAIMGNAGAAGAFPASLANANVKPGPAPTAAASQSDMGSAIAAVTMMVRSTEDRLKRSITTSIGSLEKATTSSFRLMELKVQSMEKELAIQKATIDEQGELIRKQSQMLESQSDMMRAMIEGQKTLIESVVELKKQQEYKSITSIVTAGSIGTVDQPIKKVGESALPIQSKNSVDRESTKERDKIPTKGNVIVGKKDISVLSSDKVDVTSSTIMNKSQTSIPDPFAILEEEEDLMGFGDESDFRRSVMYSINNETTSGEEVQDLLGFSDEVVEVSAASTENIHNGTANDRSLSGLGKQIENPMDEGSVYESVIECLGLSVHTQRKMIITENGKKRQDDFIKKNNEEHSTMTIASVSSFDRSSLDLHRGGGSDNKSVDKVDVHKGGSMFKSVPSFGSAGVDDDINGSEEKKATDTTAK